MTARAALIWALVSDFSALLTLKFIPGDGRARKAVMAEPSMILDADQSAAVRNRLVVEIASMSSADDAAAWAREALAAKNDLTTPDAKLVEDAFEQRLSQLGSSETARSDDHPSMFEAGRRERF
jgi:hypothetical protein